MIGGQRIKKYLHNFPGLYNFWNIYSDLDFVYIHSVDRDSRYLGDPSLFCRAMRV